MTARLLTIFLCSVLLLNDVYSQCIPRNAIYGPGYNLNNGLARIGANPLANSCNFAGPPLPMPPGVSVSADNLIIDGFLDVTGRLPFLGTVAVEGLVGNDGLVQVAYGCGNGNIGIIDGLRGANAIGNVGQILGYNGGIPLGYSCV